MRYSDTPDLPHVSPRMQKTLLIPVMKINNSQGESVMVLPNIAVSFSVQVECPRQSPWGSLGGNLDLYLDSSGGQR